MPRLLPMRSIGAPSKARSSSARNLARATAEKGREEIASGLGTASLVRVPSQTLNINTMGLLSAQFQACKGTEKGSRAAESDAEKMRNKFFGNGVNSENRFGSQCVSSGSEHEFNSVCLGAMVNGFIENEADNGRFSRPLCNCEASGAMCDCNDFDESMSSLGELAELLTGLVSSTNVTERVLLAEVNKAMASARELTSSEDDVTFCLRRQVMKHLRTVGYNAAICKSRWDHAGSFPGGDYEYIDVVFESEIGNSERIIIDIDFRAQFEIARPTSCYNALVRVLPTVFVGKADCLLQVVNFMSDAVKTSLKERDMHLPPWRKPAYMRAKWFAFYKRTTNATVQKTSNDGFSDISRIAVRDHGWDSKYTDVMEVDYLRGGERRTVKDFKNPVCKNLTGVPCKPSAPEPIKSTVDNNEWQPPVLKPRVFQRPCQAGLASVLREAGLTSSFRLIEEQRLERKSLPIPV
uniref:DUF506 family protein n=1 Tax=Physcomitrium patens TaxID=3218 RepID=A0A2K1L1G5_PHYPA|nr:uncharacterized protein LOC112279052 [Physcomitrium patens]PNR59870.1 hypothetical protein PHYPA_002662 [Physcomitrium patens]|eukprot:XP_024368885.1 uncharacterized protein LOC112279052 [Physcomitrella patens]